MNLAKLPLVYLFLALLPFSNALSLPVLAQDAAPASSQSVPPPPASVPAPTTIAPTPSTLTAPASQPVIELDKEPVPNNPAAALQLVSRANGLGGDDLRPWYLKAHYQAYDAHGKPASKGIFQLYWAAKDHYRVEYAGDDFTQTIYKNKEGMYRLGDAGGVPYAESQIWKQFLHPVEVPEKSPVPTLRDERVGNLTETCLEFQGDRTNTNKTLYCLEPKVPLLRTVGSDGYVIVFNKIRLFQHHFAAGEITVADYGFPLVTITLDELHGMSDLQALVPPGDASKIGGATTANSDGTGTITGSVIAGQFLHKSQPDYPMQAKLRHAQGTVRISATIGKDGRVRDPKVVHDPDDQLSKAALEAVSRWTYAPYLLNGQPVEVQTQMNVTFTLGR